MLEKRIYLVDIDGISDTKVDKIIQGEMSNGDFMHIAEEQGNVYSLQGFQNAFNNEEINTTHYYMRILDVEIPLSINSLKCPHCQSEGELCDFPDLYYDGCGADFADTDDAQAELYDEQAKLQSELQYLGYNIVTCGNCGDVFIHRT